jgi:DNA gyrase subunit A
MNISGEGNQVLTMDVARDDQEVLVVTENGFGKRTPVSEYRKTSRGAKGVQTIKFSEKRGGLAAALVVRPHQELVFISQEGMVQRTGVRGIRQTGRAAQGVTLMNVREEDRVSAVALVVESETSTAAAVAEGAPAIEGDPVDALAAAEAAESNGGGPDLDAEDASDVGDAPTDGNSPNGD